MEGKLTSPIFEKTAIEQISLCKAFLEYEKSNYAETL